MSSGYSVQYLDSGELPLLDCVICNNSIGNSLTVHMTCTTLTINFLTSEKTCGLAYISGHTSFYFTL